MVTQYYGLMKGDEGEIRGLMKVVRPDKDKSFSDLQYWSWKKQDWVQDFTLISYIAGGDSAMTMPITEEEANAYIEKFRGEKR